MILTDLMKLLLIESGLFFISKFPVVTLFILDYISIKMSFCIERNPFNCKNMYIFYGILFPQSEGEMKWKFLVVL